MATVTHIRPRRTEDTHLDEALVRLARRARKGSPGAKRALSLLIGYAGGQVSQDTLLRKLR